MLNTGIFFIWPNKANNMKFVPSKDSNQLVYKIARSRSTLCPHWVAATSWCLHVDREDSDHTGQMSQAGLVLQLAHRVSCNIHQSLALI